MFKNASDVAARLAERYSGPLLTREGNGGMDFEYVPWTETYRLLNDIFGPFGWSTTAPHSYYANGAYNVEFGLTVTVRDDTNDDEYGPLVHKTVPAQGQAIARNEKDDNALKSAQSDALSRGAKLLGDAFGFFLYEKKGHAAPSTNARRYPASQGSSQSQPTIREPNAPASVAQVGFLTRNGWTQADAKALTKGAASDAIAAIKEKEPLPF